MFNLGKDLDLLWNPNREAGIKSYNYLNILQIQVYPT
jgi:hypothetical protein